MRSAAVIAASLLVITAAGCGSKPGPHRDFSRVGQPAQNGAPGARRGGHLTYLTSGDVDFIDPGLLYTFFGGQVLIATNRPLYAYRPADSATPVPDLASGPPQISADDKSITVHIRPGIHYSSPLEHETVKSQDVKYAFERAFTKQVPNGYVAAYFGSLRGAPAKPNSGNYRPIPGIETPNDTTIILRFTEPVASFLAGALVNPVTVPVPKAYAFRFDQHTPSTYNVHAVFTGPYMIRHDRSGFLTGYVPGKEIDLVRNPAWTSATDYRPAYLDAITIREGNDLNVASVQTLRGSGYVCCDSTQPPPSIVKLAVERYSRQLYRVPGPGWRYVALNTTISPLDHVDVRRAIYAAVDRSALRRIFGGPAIGPVATGFIPPGISGFAASGGAAQGAQYDFNRAINHAPALARRYLRRAKALDPALPIDASGKWTGTQQLTMVSPNTQPGLDAGEALRQEVASLGFRIHFIPVSEEAIYTKYCTVPALKIAICTGLQWFRLFPDPETLLDPTFNGKNITPVNNNNKPQLNDPVVNQAIRAAQLSHGAARIRAWAKVDNLVIGTAAAIPITWDDALSIASKNVREAVSNWLTGPDLDFTSIG